MREAGANGMGKKSLGDAGRRRKPEDLHIMSASAAAQQLVLEKQPPMRAGMQGGSPACPHRQQHNI